jgi:hypothetical protein
MAVKILIEHKVKNGNMGAASRLLINNRSEVMKRPGYVSAFIFCRFNPSAADGV